MKRLTIAAFALYVLISQPSALPAQDSASDAPVALPLAVAQLFTDLTAIPTGATVTDAQHQALVADLDALAAGVFTPDPDDVDQLATDLGTAAAAGLFTSDFETELAADFSADSSDPDNLDDPNDPDGWIEDFEDDVSDLLNPVSVTDPTGTYLPTYILGTSVVGGSAGIISGSYTRSLLPLTAQGIPEGLLENYSGSVRLATRQAVGATAVLKLTVRTNGLPPSNPYTISIVRRSDGATVVIGKLRVSNGSDDLTARALSARPAAELLTSGRATFGGPDARKPLPTGFDPDDVASVTLTDSQGVVRLSGSVAGAPSTRQVEGMRLHLSGTSVAPAAAPSADMIVRHAVTSATTSDFFRFMARHLPVNAPVTLLADGVVVDHYTTTANGRLFIIEGFDPTKLQRNGISPPFNSLPPGTDLSATKTFTVTDTLGTVLLSGSLD